MTRGFALVLLLFSVPLASAQTDAIDANPFNRDQLTRIIAWADQKEELSGRLPAADFFKEPTPVETSTESPDGETTTRQVRLRSKGADGEFFILERLDEQDELLQTDMIRYHYDSGLYHRWEIPADETQPVRFLLGDRFLNESPDERRQLERENHPQVISIQWFNPESAKPGRPVVIFHESFLALPSGEQGYRAARSEYRGGRRLTRDFTRWFENGDPSVPDQEGPPGDGWPPLTRVSPGGLATSDLENGLPLLPEEGQLEALARLRRELNLEPTNRFSLEPEDPDGLLPRIPESLLERIKQIAERAGEDRPEGPGPANEGKPEVFEDLNFSYTMTQPGFVKVNAKRFHPNASLFYLNNQGEEGFFVVVETGGPDALTTEQLLELARTGLAARMEITEESKSKPVKIDEVPFQALTLSGKLGQYEATYSIMATSHNGHLVRLVAYGMHDDLEKADQQGLALARNFKFLDRDKKTAGSALSRDKYHNEPLGIHFDPAPLRGLYWDPSVLRQQFPTASYGTRLSMNNGMFIVPVDLHGLDPVPDDLTASLLEQAGIDHQTQIDRKVPVTQGTAKGQEYHSKTRANGLSFAYRVRILENEGTAVMLCSLGVMGEKDNEEESLAKLGSLLEAVEITKPQPFETREEQSRHREQDALIINDLGLRLLERQENARAVPFFARALELVPSDLAYATNLIMAKRFSGDPRGALAVYREAREQHPENLTLASHEPFLLLDLERREEAVKSFGALFDRGFRDEDTLIEYLNLLNGLGQIKEAVAVIDAYRERFPDSGPLPRKWQHQVYAEDGRHEEALQLARELATEYPRNEEFQNDLLIALVGAGRHEEAIPLIEARLETSPADPFLLYQKGLAHQGARQFRKAKEAYQLALEAAPNTPVLAEAIRQVSAMLGQGDQSSIRKEISPVPIPKDVLEALGNAEGDDKSQGFNHHLVQSVVAYEFQKDQSWKTTYYDTVKVYNQGGVEDFKSIRFAFDPTYQRAYLNSVEVIDADGRALPDQGEVESYVSDTSARDGAMATTMSSVTATVPGLKPGCTLKYSYTIENLARPEEIPYEINYFATMGRGGSKAVVLTGDLDDLGVVTRNGELEEIKGEGHRAWVLRAVPTFHAETIQPALDHFLPLLAFGDRSKSWGALHKNYQRDLEDRLRIPPSIRTLAESTTKDCRNEEEKADAIMRFVQDHLVYQAIEFGKRARIPSKADMIHANRYGDCKDHSLLAWQMFQAVDVPASLTLVSSRGPLFEEIPSLDQFDHMIVHLPTIRGGTFYDGTEKNTPVGHRAPLYLAGQKAFILGEDTAELVTIPFDSSRPQTITTKRTVRPDFDTKQLVISEKLTFTGSMAEGLRSYLREQNQANWKQSLEQLLGGQVLLTIGSLDIKGLEQPDQALEIALTYTVAESLQPSSGEVEAQLPAIWETFVLRKSRSGTRHTPFELTVPLQFESTVTLELPKSHQVTRTGWQASESQSKIVTHTTSLDGPLTLQSSVRSQRGIFPAEDFSGYAKALGKAVDQVSGKFKFAEVSKQPE